MLTMSDGPEYHLKLTVLTPISSKSMIMVTMSSGIIFSSPSNIAVINEDVSANKTFTAFETSLFTFGQQTI